MKKSSAKKLEGMYFYLLDEKNSIVAKVEENENRIKEIDLYLKSLFEKEDSDFKVFSPRNIETVFKDTIEEHKEEKQRLENENNSYYQKISLLTSHINALAEALPGIKSEGDEIGHNRITDALNDSFFTSLDERLNVLSIQEEERSRIARDLHDTSLQNLAHLVHKIELSSLYIDSDPIKAKLELAIISKNLKDTIEDIRNVIFDLRPMSFDDLGFNETIEKLFDSIKQTASINATADMDRIDIVNELVLMTIYRIIYELSTNAVKHAECTEISLLIRALPEKYKITFSDNGKGFNVKEAKGRKNNHYGLTIIYERVKLLGGTVTIDSIVDKGTTYHIEIPKL